MTEMFFSVSSVLFLVWGIESYKKKEITILIFYHIKLSNLVMNICKETPCRNFSKSCLF